MTAKEYFEIVQSKINRIDMIAEEVQKVQAMQYLLKGVDPSKEKVSGSSSSDLSDKVIILENYYSKVERELISLYEIKYNCMERIENMYSDDKDEALMCKNILIRWYFKNDSVKEKAAWMGVSCTQNAYRKLNKALSLFEKNYGRELKSMRGIS